MLFWISDLKIIFNFRILWAKSYLEVFFCIYAYMCIYTYSYITKGNWCHWNCLLVIYATKIWFLDILMGSRLGDQQGYIWWQNLCLTFLCIFCNNIVHTTDRLFKKCYKYYKLGFFCAMDSFGCTVKCFQNY